MVTKDILWKGIIEDLFDDFLLYFFPAFAQKVNFQKGFEFLDKELDSLLPETEAGKRYADKLVKIFTKQGTAHYILLHIEVQGYPDKHFAERMFTYFYRIRDRWKADVMAFALYTDAVFAPMQYHYEFEETSNLYQFKTFKLSEQTPQTLAIPDNPFSIVMLTAYNALQKNLQSDKAQLIWKTTLVRNLWEAGYPKEKIRNILNFIRFYIGFKVPSKALELDTEIAQIIKQPKPMGIEEAIKNALKEEALAEGMAVGKAEGKAEGKTENKTEIAEAMLEDGFSDEKIMQLLKVDKAFLDKVRQKSR